jgi:hypothetical protein
MVPVPLFLYHKKEEAYVCSLWVAYTQRVAPTLHYIVSHLLETIKSKELVALFYIELQFAMTLYTSFPWSSNYLLAYYPEALGGI